MKAAGVVRPDGSVTFSPGLELTALGCEITGRDPRPALRLPPDVERELERLKVFRGSELGRALEGRS